jgi:hypothetical protein
METDLFEAMGWVFMTVCAISFVAGCYRADGNMIVLGGAGLVAFWTGDL